MLEMIVDYYTLALAIVCVVFLNRYMNKQLMLAFACAFCFVYSLDFMQGQFGWWAKIDASFAMDVTAAAMMACALICFNRVIGGIAFATIVGYGFVLTAADLNSWLDISTSFVAGLPCFILFSSVGEDKSDSTLDT